MRRKTRLMLFALTALVAVFGGAALAREQLNFFRIGTGPTASTLYALGTAISAGISRPPGSLPCDEGGICGVPGLIAVAQSKDGSIDNLDALATGDIESALVLADMAYWAHNGGGPYSFKKSMPELRAIANLAPATVHFVVRADSDIRQIEDLRGHKVSLGAEGAGARSNAIVLLRSHGIGLDEITPFYLKPGPAADALAQGQIDAAIIVGGEPVGAITDLAERTPIRLLSIRSAEMQLIHSLYPFVSAGEIKADTYRNVPAVKTIRIGVLWVTLDRQPKALIADITRALWQSTTKELFLEDNPRSLFGDIKEATRTSGIPLHPGAEEYYKSAGMM